MQRRFRAWYSDRRPDGFRPCATGDCVTDIDDVAWYLHAVERPEGTWACLWNRHEHDSHPSLAEAVDHLRSLAGELGECELFAHHVDGAVVKLGPA